MLRKSIFFLVVAILGGLFLISPVIKEVAAGIAILLFGMIILEKGFNTFVEGTLQSLLTKATNKLYKSIGLGFVTTALIQSSSLMSVVTISFLSAGLVSLKAGIGIVFGANLGTTTTAWLVSLFGLHVDISAFAMPMLAFGVLFIFQKSKELKGTGHILTGLGLFFLGIYFMKEGFDSYQSSINLADYSIPGVLGLLVFTLVGIIITLILQSSSAAIALILTALAAGQISYTDSLSLVIGANIGTTITAILGSLSANYEGKRLAGAHFIFKLSTGIVALVLIIPLGYLVSFLASWIGIAEDNYTLKLALFHTIFNLVGVLLMLPVLDPLVAFLERLFKDTRAEETRIEYPIYLNESVMDYPQSAAQALLDESKRLFENACFQIVSHGLNLRRTDIKGSEKIKKVVRSSKTAIKVNIQELYYDKVKLIYSKIIKYATLSQSKFSLSEEAMEGFTRIKLANRNMVEVIKATQTVSENVGNYMLSDNPYIQKEYDRLRRKVSRVLREVYRTKKDDSPENHLKRLDKLKTKALETDVLKDGTLDQLIREQKISSVMATSLANDSRLIGIIMKKLVETAELLYIESDTLLKLTQPRKSYKG